MPPLEWRRYAHSFDRHGRRHPSRFISTIVRKMPNYTTTKLKAAHNQDTIYIYTDGSGIVGQIGAAAYCPTLGETKRQYVSLETLFNVFVAEVSAMTLATE